MVYCYGDLVPPPGPPPGPALLSRPAPALTLQAAQLAVLAAGILAMYDAGVNHKTVSTTNKKAKPTTNFFLLNESLGKWNIVIVLLPKYQMCVLAVCVAAW